MDLDNSSLTAQNPHSSLLRSRSDGQNHPHRSTVSLVSTFSEHTTTSAPSPRSSRRFSSSTNSVTPDEYNDEPSPTHPLSQMGAGRFWAPRERRQPRFSFQQAREKIKLPKDIRWSEPNEPQQAGLPRSSDRDRVAEARVWIESQCATAGFGNLDLGKLPSSPLSSKKSSISLAPSVMTQSTATTVPETEIPTSAEDLQTRIDVLNDGIAERERRIRTRQQLERLQAEYESQRLQAPSIEVIFDKAEHKPSESTLIELDSRSVTNLSILEETEDKEGLPAYSNPLGIAVMDYKSYRPPPPPHPAFSSYQLVEPGHTEGLDRSRNDSLTPKPYAHDSAEPVTTPVVMTPPEETRDLKSQYRPIMHQRTLSAPGDRPAQIPSEQPNCGRGRSVSIATGNLSPTPNSSISSSATTWDPSTAATTPSEDLKNTFLSVSSARSPPPAPVSVPTTPIEYCSDPIALSPTEHPSEDISLFEDLESLAGAYRIKPRSSMSNLQRNLSHQAPIPVRNPTTKSQRMSYMAGQAPIPDLPEWQR